VAIVVLALWIAAAVAGVTLLRAGGAARRGAASVPAELVKAVSDQAVSVAAVPLGAVPLEAVPLEAVSAVKAGARIGAVPLTADGKPPPGPHVRVRSPAGEHPLLEFCHPALAATGIACWLMFVLVHYRPFAWIAFAILLVTMAVGLAWLAATRRAGKARVANHGDARHGDARHGGAIKGAYGAGLSWTFPPRLIALHGLAVTLAIALTVLTAISAST
jgi:hypothetical protein